MTRSIPFLLAVIGSSFFITSCKKDDDSSTPDRKLVPQLGPVLEREPRSGDEITCGLSQDDMIFLRDSGGGIVTIRFFNSRVAQKPRQVSVVEYHKAFARYKLRSLSSVNNNRDEADLKGDTIFCDAVRGNDQSLADSAAQEGDRRSAALAIANTPPMPATEVNIDVNNAVGERGQITCRAKPDMNDADGDAVTVTALLVDAKQPSQIYASGSLDAQVQQIELNIATEHSGKQIQCVVRSEDGSDTTEAWSSELIAIPTDGTPPTENPGTTPTPTPEVTPDVTPPPPPPTPTPEPTPRVWTAPEAPELAPNAAVTGSALMCKAKFEAKDVNDKDVTEAIIRFYRVRGEEKIERHVRKFSVEEIRSPLRFAFYILKTGRAGDATEADRDVRGDKFFCTVTVSNGDQTLTSAESKTIVVADSAPLVFATQPQTQYGLFAGQKIQPVKLSFEDVDGDELSNYVKKEDSCNMLTLEDGNRIVGTMPDQAYPPTAKWCIGKFRAVTNGLESSNEVIVSFYMPNHAPKLKCDMARSGFAPGTPITGVRCLGEDSDRNAKLTYSIDSGCAGVTINETSGEVGGTMPPTSCTAQVTVSDGADIAKASISLNTSL